MRTPTRILVLACSVWAVAAAHGDFETLTGGSLGSFRRVRRTQGSWLASFAINAGLFDLQPGARVAILGRLSHSLALYGALEGVCLGASVHLLDDLRPDHQQRALAGRGITHLYATPAQLRMVAGAAGPTPNPKPVARIVPPVCTGKSPKRLMRFCSSTVSVLTDSLAIQVLSTNVISSRRIIQLAPVWRFWLWVCSICTLLIYL
jgi:hypothetical protein